MKKVLNVMALFAVLSLLLSSAVIADTSDLSWDYVKINGDYIDFGDDGDLISVEEGSTIEVKIGLEADADVDDIMVEAEISGYEYSDYQALEDTTTLFDMTSGTSKSVSLDIELPVQLDKDEYFLRLRVTDKNSDTMSEIVRLHIEPNRHGVNVADVVFSPGSEVEAGRSLLTTVLLQNFGDNDEEDVKVEVSIDALGVSATDYVDLFEINADAGSVTYETTEEMFLSIPDCATPGDYVVDVDVTYDTYETVSKSYALTVVEGSYCDVDSEKLMIAVGPETQNVKAGQQAVYMLNLINDGTNSETYVLELTAGDWAQTSLSEALVVLSAEGGHSVVYAYVNVAEDAALGAQIANLVISNEGEVLETISLTANVEANENSSDLSLRNGLELALIILVVLLVIVGLIIGFTRLRRDEEEEQTYY